MVVRRPTPADLGAVADRVSLRLGKEDLEFFADEVARVLAAYDVVDALPDYLPTSPSRLGQGYRPSAAEDPLNAWYVKTDIKERSTGKLHGKTVAVKDNVAVAGVPMMNGASTLEGYIPKVDATVVTRLLAEGATISGKSQCEYLCMSGGSHTGAQGPVRNPHKTDHSAAGSSSGSAALVAAGEVDMAIGGDQGGSIRTPASYCGIVGLKPTWGLVPYTGAMPIELTLDHLGPMTRTVADNALLLEVIAGYDGLDPRQPPSARAEEYTRHLHKSCKGLRIGVLKEGFGHANAESDVDEAVRAAGRLFTELGASVHEASVEMHTIAPSIWSVVASEGATQQMMKGNSHGWNWKGLYLTDMIEAHAAWQQRSGELPDTVKLTMLVGEHMHREGGGLYYAKAQNLSRKLRAEYDRCLGEFDLLLMPTTPMKAPLLPGPNVSRRTYIQRAMENMANTFPFDLTGHPAISLPCGSHGDLPIGMMLVGRHFEEGTIYQAAHAFEQGIA